MESLLLWVTVWMVTLGAALFWLCYLIRLMLQEEVSKENGRQRMRDRELRRRAIEDEENVRRAKQLQRQRAAARATTIAAAAARTSVPAAETKSH